MQNIHVRIEQIAHSEALFTQDAQHLAKGTRRTMAQIQIYFRNWGGGQPGSKVRVNDNDDACMTP